MSLGVFTMAILISLSSLFAVTDAQRKAVALQNTLDNLRFSLEAATKEIRTGSSYHCASEIALTPQDCSAGSSFTFRNAEGETVSYFLESGQFMKKVGANVARPLTAATVKIQKLSFYVSGTASGDQKQPYVTILIEGKVSPTPRTETVFPLEAAVSQRKLDS